VEREVRVAGALERLDVLGRDAVVVGAHEPVDRGRSIAKRFHLADVLDRDAVRSRALDLVERELGIALGGERLDVARSDVVNRQLKTPPDWKVVVVAERLHLAGVLGARREAEKACASSVAERALEGEIAGLTVKLELQVGRGEVLIVRRQPAKFLNRKRL